MVGMKNADRCSGQRFLKEVGSVRGNAADMKNSDQDTQSWSEKPVCVGTDPKLVIVWGGVMY